jgi:hypothetical protein
MADESDFTTSAQPTLQQLATFFADELFDVKRVKRFETAMRNAHAEGATVAHAATIEASGAISEKRKSIIDAVEDYGSFGLSFLLSKLVTHMLGVEADIPSMHSSGGDPTESGIGQRVAAVMMKAMNGADGELVPSDKGATKLLGASIHLALQSWFEGILIEQLSSFEGLVHVSEDIADVGHQLIDAMGLNRLMRTALRPIVHHTISTPLDWKISKDVRPTLLSSGTAIREFTRGHWTFEQLTEELARQGYSDARIQALLNESRRFLSEDDLQHLIRAGVVNTEYATLHLKSAGHGDDLIPYELQLPDIKRLESFERDMATVAIAAYADRRIERAHLDEFTHGATIPAKESAQLQELAEAKRALSVKGLSPSEARACVLKKVLPIAGYREALRRDGYDEESVLALELLLETDLDEQADVETLRVRKDAERAAADAQKRADAEAKAAKAEEAAALARRGNLAELRRAAVRGVVPFARVEELLRASFDADYVAAYMTVVEQDRQAYLAQQAKADDAAKRATLRHVDVGTLQQAVYADIIDIGRFRAQLAALDFDPADVDILVATTRARYADLKRAQAKRDAADAAAKKKSIDLGRFESLVRRGVRSLADYATLLRSLDFDDASIADMRELLQLQIADDAAAAKARADAAAVKDAKGVTLEQFRRAVILGTRTIDELARWLIDNKFTADAQVLILDEARADVADAEAARQRRDETDDAIGPRALPLSTVARAARLGIITPDVYEAQLRAFGYDDDAVAIEMTLLIKEIADVRATEAAQQAADAGAQDGGLSLAQLAAAVRAGVRPLSDYQARAATLVGNVDDVNTLVRVLADQLASAEAARARRQALGSTVKVGDVSIGVLESQVRAGQLELDAYAGQLVAAGVDPVDVDLLVSLLVDELAG